VPVNDRFPSGPRALPDLRLTLLDRWRPGQPFWRGDAARERAAGHSMPRLSFDSVALARAELWWATHDLSTLVEHAARTLPSTTLSDELLPGRLPNAAWGLVVFAHPLVGTDAKNGDAMLTSALLWGLCGIDERHGVTYWPEDGSTVDDDEIVDGHTLHRALTISTYVHAPPNGVAGPLINRDEEVNGEWVRNAGFEGVWLATGRQQWRFGFDVMRPCWYEAPESSPGLRALSSPHAIASMAEERRWLAALWLLAAQPLTDVVEQRVDKAARRRSQRAGVSTSSVRLVDVRHKRSATSSDSERRVDWHNRWIVEGHWRQQAHGPGWSLRKPVFVDEYVKGPADKPLVVREHVNVVRASNDDAST